MVYLDVASTAKYRDVDNIVVNEITNAMIDDWQNPSSLYAISVREKINKCRSNIAKFIGAEPHEIYFTSGSSESNNWAIRGWVDNETSAIGGLLPINVITTLIEHKSVLSLVQNKEMNFVVHYCDVDGDGFVDFNSLERLLLKCEYEPTLVSIGMANNEIGTVQNIKRISDLVHKYGGVLHTDATQAFGHIPINVEKLGIDMLSASGHKVSPVLRGIGLLYKKSEIDIKPLIYGAQENGLRGGTENTYGIIGLNKAIEYCDFGYESTSLICEKRDYFISILESKFGCRLNGHGKYRLPNNINVTFPQNITGEGMLYILDASGIKISTGSACNSKSIEPSSVLKAIGLNDREAMKTVRLTLPDSITYEQIDNVICEIEKAMEIIESF